MNRLKNHLGIDTLLGKREALVRLLWFVCREYYDFSETLKRIKADELSFAQTVPRTATWSVVPLPKTVFFKEIYMSIQKS